MAGVHSPILRLHGHHVAPLWAADGFDWLVRGSGALLQVIFGDVHDLPLLLSLLQNIERGSCVRAAAGSHPSSSSGWRSVRTLVHAQRFCLVAGKKA